MKARQGTGASPAVVLVSVMVMTVESAEVF
jgi:hypothetical protein